MTPAQIVRYLLLDLGLGVLHTSSTPSPDWSVFVDDEPAFPDRCITVYDRQATQDGRFMVNGQIKEADGIQIRVRATSIVEGRTKVKAIRVALSESVYQRSFLTSGTHPETIHALVNIGPILYNGKEQSSNREVYTLNFNVRF